LSSRPAMHQHRVSRETHREIGVVGPGSRANALARDDILDIAR